MPRFVTIAFAFALAARAAFGADDPFARGIDTVPFKLTPTLNGGMTLEGAELAETNTWQLAAALDLNVGVLAMKVGQNRLGDLIPLRTDLHIFYARQVHPRIEVSGDLPLTVFQWANFGLLTDQGFPQENPKAVGLGAPRLLGRFQLLRVSEFPIASVAAIAELRFPFGDTKSFLSDRGLVFAPRLAAERRLGPFRVIVNAGWRLRSAPGRFMNLYVGHEFVLGGAGELDFPDFGKLRQPHALVELNMATPAEAPFTFRDAEALKTPLELVVGGHALLGPHLTVNAGVARGLGANGYGHETLRVFGGLAYVEEPPPPDDDGDGIPNSVDQCPNQAEVQNGYNDVDGCPDYEPIKDTDNDGVPDTVDSCPNDPGPMELDGCPDTDGDQLADLVDKCPKEAGPPELAGCPPPPEEEPVVLESERIRINNQILFELGKAKIDPQSYKLLDGVVKVLKEHPDVGPVLIEGHTDASGPAAYNLDLSRKRARAVEDYIADKGIDRSRLRSAGYSFEQPIAPNDTPVNRAKNRRTEFRLVDADEGKKDGSDAPDKAQDGKGSSTKADPKKAPDAKKAADPKKPAEAKKPAGK